MRGKWFITPKNSEVISVHIHDKELNEKLIAYGKSRNINLSLLVTKLCKINSSIDDLIDVAEREQYSILSDEEKIDLIISLKNQMKEDKSNA